MLPECLPIAVVAFSIGQVCIRPLRWNLKILTCNPALKCSIRVWATCLVLSMAIRCRQIRCIPLCEVELVCSILFLSQELLAQGVSNLVGSFMSCLPMSGSLSRSLVQVEQLNIENSNPLKLVIQESSGCKSLLTGLTSAIFLLGVLLFLGPIFQVLWRQSCLP